jgi:multidrug efflux system outer membrane protein
MRTLRLPLALVVAGSLSACAVPEAFRRPDLSLPGAYPGAAAGTEGAPALGSVGWQAVFTDTALRGLIEEALRSGPDGLIAAARVRESAALIGLARAPALPSLAASLNTTPIARLPGQNLSSSYLAGGAVSWELDLWGRYARATDAARADLLAATENRHAVSASLVGNMASLYYQLGALRESEAVLQASVNSQQEGLRIIQRMSQAGIVSAAEERQQESAIAASQARLPGLRRQMLEVQNAIALLLGRPPGSVTIPAATTLVLPAALPAGLPSALLTRRPDIRRAEAQLAAADARVAEARARFFPQLSLTAVLGVTSTALSSLLGGGAATVASLGPGLVAPLYTGGSLSANRDAALARLDQSLLAYRKTVFAALGEVADGLQAYESSAEAQRLQEARVAIGAEALRLAELRFRAGTTSFLEVLDAQRQLLAAQLDAVQAVLDRRLALVRVYLALGGGWESPT